MPYQRGTEKYRHYWDARVRGKSRKEAEAYAEAQSAAVAAETASLGSGAPEGDNAAPEPSGGSGQRMAGSPHDIPEDWRELPWPDLRALATRLSGEPVNSRAECERVIEAKVQAAG